jgi:hypothetical protein
MGRHWFHHLGGRYGHRARRSQQLNREGSHNKGAKKASGNGDGMTA